MPAYTRVGGIWRENDVLSVRVNGTWREVDTGYVRVAGIWREVYQGYIVSVVYVAGDEYLEGYWEDAGGTGDGSFYQHDDWMRVSSWGTQWGGGQRTGRSIVNVDLTGWWDLIFDWAQTQSGNGRSYLGVSTHSHYSYFYYNEYAEFEGRVSRRETVIDLSNLSGDYWVKFTARSFADWNNCMVYIYKITFIGDP